MTPISSMGRNAMAFAVAILPAVFLMSSCTSDSREEVSPQIPCDTDQVTYAQTIRPILDNNCIGCHSGSSPAAGLDYENYADVKLVASSGRLSGAINHRSGFRAMPLNAPKLQACDIAKIEKWISDGFLEN